MRSAIAMLAGLAAASVLAASAIPVFADTSRAHATGPNASASAAAGSSTGAPCRVIKRGHPGGSGSGLSTSITTGTGGLSGTTTIGPNGPTVTINPGNGSASTSAGTATAGGASAYAGANSGCVVTGPQDGNK